MILWWLAAVQRRANQRVQCLNFLISQAALHCGKKPNSPPFNCQPSGHCSLWWERRSARFQNKCTPNGKSNSAVRGAVRDKDVKSNRPPHTRALRHVCYYISLQLWDTREMNPCSLQLRLARVAREKVSAVTHSCCARYTISHLGRQLLSRGRLEAGNGRMSCSTHVFSSILDPICQNEPLQTQTKSCDCDFDGLYTVYEENRPLDNHPDETWWYDRLSLYGRGRILVIKGVPQSEEPCTLLLGFTLSFSLGAVLEEHIGKKIIKSWCLNVDPSQEPTCCDQAKTILIILKV